MDFGDLHDSMMTGMTTGVVIEDMIISTIRNSEDFKSALKIFLRDYKLGKILKK